MYSHEHDNSARPAGDAALLTAMLINQGLTGVEVAAGLFAGSLALLADALHNFSDGMSLLLAYVALPDCGVRIVECGLRMERHLRESTIRTPQSTIHNPHSALRN